MATVAVSYHLNSAGLTALLKGPGSEVTRDLIRRGNRGRNAAVRACPRDTGRLAQSITLAVVQVGGRTAVRWGSNLPYAIYVEQGTGIYGPRGRPIRPRRAKFLRWPVKNQSGRGRRRYRGGRTERYAYARSVRGRPATPFIEPSLRVAMSG